MDALTRLMADLGPPRQLPPPVHAPGPSAAVAGRLLDEGLISLAQAAALLPPVRGRRVATSSLFRWVVQGKRGVKLEAVRAGGPGWWTSRPAVARFLAALSVRQ